jgi:hypothetical protein
VREGLHNIFASFELLNQEGLMMCTNRLIESLKKYPEVTPNILYKLKSCIYLLNFTFRIKNLYGIV